MKVLVATEDSGCVKQVSCVRKTDTSKQSAPQPDAIETFAEAGKADCADQMIVVNDLIVLARRKGGVQVYTHEWELKLEYPGKDSESDRCIGIAEVDDTHIVTCRESGLIAKYSLTDKQTKQQKVQLAEKKLCAFTQSPFEKGVYAVGGDNVDIRILTIDFEKGSATATFKGKNVKNDRLDMPVPVYIEAIGFVSKTEYVTMTHYGELRRYDTTKGRRPQSDTKLSEKAVKSMIMMDNRQSVVYSDVHSTTGEYSLEESKFMGKYHGATGSVQAMHCKNNLLAAGGLDRYLRVFNTSDREIQAKVFVGQQITAVWVLQDSDKRANQDEQQEEDELWEGIKKRKS